MDYSATAGIEAATTWMLLFLAIYFLLFVLMIAGYVLESLGLYTIAKRRGIHHPWLAWVPVGNLWIWGCISDQYQYVVKGQIKNKRKILLTLSIILVLAGLGSSVCSLLQLWKSYAHLAPAILQLLLGLVTLVCTLISMVFQYLCLYDLYTSCKPGSSALFLVLSILFGFTRPFFIFSCRNKDLGMPPRKAALPEYE